MKILFSFLVFAMFNFVTKAQNKMYFNKNLDSKQQGVVKISALTAVGNLEDLKAELGKGLDSGMTINEIKEILTQLYAYCGFPRSLNGITTFMAVLDERKTKGIKDSEGRASSPVKDTNKYQTGKANLQKLTGREEKQLSGANAFAPAIDTFLKEHLFADIFSRDLLTFQQRELITIAALASMSGVVPQLQAHISVGINTGLSVSQLSEMFKIVDEKIGKTQGDIARATLDKILAVSNP